MASEALLTPHQMRATGEDDRPMMVEDAMSAHARTARSVSRRADQHSGQRRTRRNVMLLGHDRVRELAIRSDSAAHAELSALSARMLMLSMAYSLLLIHGS
jgi:hypothetical protein